ncbi:TPA: LOW QUALITY PROTEIN: hypothetical protein N0F65_009793 [Lagenidium giganteum]|uniref:Ricin B lectin domain-containing protein n=1 Tax=Lagenidium giganteum TaxID=4803 RepID=A0AAV2YFX7_9STRA|nr:TPA: LOW QUALITY PROTEIN: hypothetical protein N0F65_009793 [Lagenidium giganteum]
MRLPPPPPSPLFAAPGCAEMYAQSWNRGLEHSDPPVVARDRLPFVRRVQAPPRRSDDKRKAKFSLGVVSLGLVVGATLVAYQVNTNQPPNMRVEESGAMAPLEPMSLDFEQADIAAGGEFVVQLASKGFLCVDDGGGTKSGAVLTQGTCDPTNINQIFVYDAKNQMVKSARKNNLCWDDGGALFGLGLTSNQLWACDVNNKNQKWVYDSKTRMFKNPRKNNICLDDHGGRTPGANDIHPYSCDVNNANQRFLPVSLANMPKNPPYVVPAELFPGNEILLKMFDFNDICFHDGGKSTAGAADVTVWKCDRNDVSQLFTYDANTFQLRSARKKGLCLDDGGATKAGQKNMRLMNCDPNCVNQRFYYDPATMLFNNPLKGNLCLDSDGGRSNGGSKPHLWDCDQNNKNQRIEIIPRSPPAAKPFMVRSTGRYPLCLDAGGLSGFTMWTCIPDSPNQLFVYNAKHSMIHSASDDSLCWQDGGSIGKAFSLRACDVNNANQKFKYDSKTKLFSNPSKKNRCISHNGNTGSNKGLKCKVNALDQQFEIAQPNNVAASPTYTVPAALFAGQEIMLELAGKKGLCVDDGGESDDAITQVTMNTCDVSNPNQVFLYDPFTFQLRSARKPDLCLDDGGVVYGQLGFYKFWHCDPNDHNQRFFYDSSTLMLANPMKGMLCMDDGGGTRAKASTFRPNFCDGQSLNQRFRVRKLLKGDGTNPASWAPTDDSNPATRNTTGQS